MAYAVKYLFKFQSSNGIVREIRVLQDGYSGSVIQRPLGRAPVIKKEQNGGVHGTSLTFYAECHIDREYIEFYTSDPKEYRVDVYAGSTLLWQGYITPELYSEPDIAPPYDVQVVATDGVGELKLYDFAPQGTVTLRALLTYLLGYTGLTTDVNLISSLKPGSRGAGALLDMQICIDYLAGKTCYEALTYILDTLHATISRWGGAWLLVRETNVTFTGDKVRYFNTGGNSALLAGSVQTLGAMRSAPAWPVGQLSTVIDPAKNKVVVQAPWHPVTCLANPDMVSDTGWTKANNASYGPDGYLLPNNDTGGSTYATAHISQALSLAGVRTPLSFELRATGVAAQVGARVGAVIGVLLTYTVGGTVYLLRKGDEGTPIWKQGSAPGSSIDGSLVDYQQPLASFDADRIQAETLRIDEIPAFVQGTSYPSGTLTVYVVGSCARVYGAHLDVVLPKGYQDILRIDNGARGEGGTVEIAIGRQTADVAYYQAFLQGLLLDSGSLITGFSDANFTTAMDYLALISRDYALSAALPRALAKGTVYLEGSIGMPPLVFAKGGLNYWLETWSWDLYEDELEIDARTLPSASLTVQSETILESDGSTVSSSSSGSTGGGSSISPGGGTNYFQIDEDLQTLLEPKPQFDFLSPKKGLIFGTTEETDVASSPAHLMLRNLGTAQSPNYALYTPYALITGGDQIVGSGTPGGGGGGAGYLYELGDIYHDTDKTKVLRDPDYATTTGQQAQPGDVLVLDSTYGWAAVPSASIGGVTSVVGQIGDVTAQQISTAIGLSGYLPLSAGSSKPLTGNLYISAPADTAIIITNTATSATVNAIRFDLGNSAQGYLGMQNGQLFRANNNWSAQYTVYDSGNFVAGTNYVSISGAESINGQKNFITATNTVPVVISRSGGLVEALRIGVDDSNAIFVHEQDETTANYYFYGKYNDSESGGGAGAGQKYVAFYLSGATEGISINGNTVHHSGNSNRSTVQWSCSGLNAYDQGAICFYNGSTIGGGISRDADNQVRLYAQCTGTPQIQLTTDSAPIYRRSGTNYTIWHSGNFVAGTNYQTPQTTLGGYGITDWVVKYDGTNSPDTFTTSGIYRVSVQSGVPSDSSYGNILVVKGASSDTIAQIVFPYGNNNIRFRRGTTSNFTSDSWKIIWNEGNSNRSDASWRASSLTLGDTTNATNPSITFAYKYSSVAYDYRIQGYEGRLLIGPSGSQRAIQIDSSGNIFLAASSGNVGIGTGTPRTKFDVRHSGREVVNFDYTGSDTNGGYVRLALNDTTSGSLNWTSTSVVLYHTSGNTIVLDSTGVGIGTSSPDSKLHIVGAASSWTGHFASNGSEMQTHLCYPNIGMVLTYNSNASTATLLNVRNTVSSTVTSVLYVRGDGNVGIGTTSPAYKLDVGGTFRAQGGVTLGRPGTTCSAVGWYTIYTSYATNAVGDCVILHIDRSYSYTNNEAYVVAVTGVYNGNIKFTQLSGAANTQVIPKLRVVYVNSGAYIIQLYYNTTSQNAVYVTGEGSGTFSVPTRDDSPTGTAVEFSLQTSGVSTMGTVVSTGDQVISSDINLKTHFKDIALTSEQIANAPAVSFDWKDGHGHSFGSIAQYWKPLVPEAVLGEEGNYTLAYGQLGVVLGINNGKAIYKLAKHETEQDKEIRELRQKVQKLEMDNLRLKARLNMS